MYDITINTDFLQNAGSPEPHLQAIAEAGFTHLHWCHQWYTDFLYSRHEIAQYKKWLCELGLTLQDIHGSMGLEKCWFATEEYRRQAGVELVVNRLEMMAEMEAIGGLIMHIPLLTGDETPEKRAQTMAEYAALRRSLDELMPVLERYGLCIAVENGFNDDFTLITALMRDYPAEQLGITYDSGHGHIDRDQGLDLLEPLKDRIRVLHLHDNDSVDDLHQPPFYGTLDWERLIDLLRRSSYAAAGLPLSFEMGMTNTPFFEPAYKRDQRPEAIRAFLHDAYERASRVTARYLRQD